MHSYENRVKWGLLGAKAKWDKQPPFAERFWRRVKKGTPTECWLWQGSVCAGNLYGKYKLRGKTASTHRIAYELARGPIPQGLDVCHHCDVRLCCNPQHLFLGTAKDNAQDAAKKGRLNHTRPWPGPRLKGEASPLAKLTLPEVRAIRSLSAAGTPQKEIGQFFGIGQDEVSRIVHFKRWAHVT